MHCFRYAFFTWTLCVAVCMLTFVCMGLFMASSPVYAAAPTTPQKARNASSKNAAKPGWDFQAPDRSVQNARWRESISTTLQQTTFAPSTPAGRYLQHQAANSGKRLPPAQLDDLDKVRPPENKQHMPGGNTFVHGELVKERIGWRPHSSEGVEPGGAPPALKEERRAGAYAGFHPSEDVALKLGPEYHLSTSVLRPEQTGNSKDNSGTVGMGMRLKIDF